jgi:hypothetical protein
VVQPGAADRGPVDVTSYTPSAEPGARLPHRWLPDGSSLYDRLGTGFSLVGPVQAGDRGVADQLERASRRRIRLALLEPPPPPWPDGFLLVRPDQHIAARAADAADIDLDLAAGYTSGAPAPTAGD